MVKKQEKKYAFTNLMEKKKKHSKMDNVEYEELKKQDYFSIKGINFVEVRNIFKIGWLPMDRILEVAKKL